jgi:hypothetical protein
VKRCVSKTDGGVYAVKIVNQSVLKRKRIGRFGTALDNVKKEMAIWKKLDHDNVVHLVEIIDDPGAVAQPFIVRCSVVQGSRRSCDTCPLWRFSSPLQRRTSCS